MLNLTREQTSPALCLGGKIESTHQLDPRCRSPVYNILHLSCLVLNYGEVNNLFLMLFVVMSL